MKEILNQTESLLEIAKGIEARAIMLPEFQRDFKWDLDRTYALFDSLIREIFIGTLIYGTPSFGLTLREIDRRPRKAKGRLGRNAKIETVDYDDVQIKQAVQTRHLRVVLDGQQRITAIYRAMTNLDEVWVVLNQDLDTSDLGPLSLEQMVSDVVGEQSPDAISVRLADAYEFEIKGLDEDELNVRFDASRYAINHLADVPEPARLLARRVYRLAIRKVVDLYKQQKMVSYYLLDMSLAKFCLFFERSNSRGIQLDFTDILAAKLYQGFNLRQKIEEFESLNNFALNREIIVRAIAYVVAADSGRPISIDRQFILENLKWEHFETHWDAVCKLYTDSLHYLAAQHYILSQRWMPSENMVIPLMMFLRRLKSFDRMNEEQRLFVEYWYWASIFANRYSAASNEIIMVDSRVLTRIAQGERIEERGYFIRMRSLITEPEDLFSYTKRSSTIYRGLLNLLGYASHGLKDWRNAQMIDVSMDLEDHHIYPTAYIRNATAMEGIERGEAEQLVDCVVNRTLIPKLLNIQIGKKAPGTYLRELEQTNSHLIDCLDAHLLPKDILTDPTWNTYFMLFLKDRAQRMFELVTRYTTEQANRMAERYGTQEEKAIFPRDTRVRPDLLPADSMSGDPTAAPMPLETDGIDTVVVPAREEGFQETFLGEKRWHAIRLDPTMLSRIKYIAVYRVAPLSAITHIGPVASIELWQDTGKYVVNLAAPASPLGPVRLLPGGRVKGPQNLRYTSRQRLEQAQTLDDLW